MMNDTYILARDLREGDILGYDVEKWNTRVDGVEWDGVGDIKVLIGNGTTDVQWFEPQEFVKILPR